MGRAKQSHIRIVRILPDGRVLDGFNQRQPFLMSSTNFGSTRKNFLHIPIPHSFALNQTQRLRKFLAILTVLSQELLWTPWVSRSFLNYLRTTVDGESEQRRWNDRSTNVILAHLKTFSKWLHEHRPFPLNDPMLKVKLSRTTSLLRIERALTDTERRRILDAADLLVQIGGRSKDRNRYPKGKRPTRKRYRPYRNRAIIYTLIETGMRRAAVSSINVSGVDFEKREIETIEKGGRQQLYDIGAGGIAAIQDYLNNEREDDATFADSPALFLPTPGGKKSSKNNCPRISVRLINYIWDQVCAQAGVEGKSPHGARHAMGVYMNEKLGVAGVQRQLGHKNAIYSLEYSRIRKTLLQTTLDSMD